MKYCGMCGAPIAKTCPNCSFANPQPYRFCGMCGTSLLENITSLPRMKAAFPSPRAPELPDAVHIEDAVNLLPQGERMVVTVLLTDVTGSTNLLEQVGNEVWVEIMNRILYAQEREVERYGGRVDQFRGDGLVAFFGAATAHEDDPERAILTALSMQQTVKEIAKELHQQMGIDLQLRVGINTGEVIILPKGVGIQERDDTAMGMAIAISARMESAAEPGTVLVSEYTYQLAADQFDWLSLGEISVRGISHPIAVYRPLVAKVGVDRLEFQFSFEACIPMIGREKEFELLRQQVEALNNKKGGIVLIDGDAGIGKSHLLRETQQYFVRQNSLLMEAQDKTKQPFVNLAASMNWLQGRCRSYNSDFPYSMWVDILQAWLRSLPGNPDESMAEKLRRQAHVFLGEEAQNYLPCLFRLLSLSWEEQETELPILQDAESTHQKINWVIYSWIRALTTQESVVLAFSDMQWADQTSLELLKYCLDLSESESVLWLLSFRSDRTTPIWNFRHFIETQYPHRLSMIELKNLSFEQCERLITAVVGSSTLPQELLEQICKNSEGNPYFILEILRSMMENGTLVRESDADEWRLKVTGEDLVLPNSLYNLIQARVYRLAPTERHVLQLAAVIGVVFWSDPLAALLGATPTFERRLSALQRFQLIEERSRVTPLGTEYSFTTKLIRDVAYESLLSHQRMAFHLKVAEFFEQKVPPPVQKQYQGLIAYHFCQAGNPNKELFYTLQAAVRAREMYANQEALEHCNRALEILQKMEQSTSDFDLLYAIHSQIFEVYDIRSTLFYLIGDVEMADADSRRLLSLAHQLEDDPAWMVDALLKHPSVRRLDNREMIGESFTMVETALILVRQIKDKHREMFGLIALGNLFHVVRDPKWKQTMEESLALAREVGDRRAEANILLNIGSVYGMDNIQKSREYFDAALAVGQGLNDKRTEIRLLSAIGEQVERQGDYHRFLTDFLRKRLDLSREVSDRLMEGFSLMFCAQVQGIYLGDYEPSLKMAKESLRITRHLTSSLYPLLRVIQLLIAMGLNEEARQHLDLAQNKAADEVEDLGRVGFAMVSAIFHYSQGGEANLHTALENCSTVLQLTRQGKVSKQYQMAAQSLASAVYMGLAHAAQDSNIRMDFVRKALNASGEALEIYESFGFVQVIESTSEEIFFRHSQALQLNEQPAESLITLEKAHQEMMRKARFIPTTSPLHRSYLENIPLHKEIQAAYKTLRKKPEK